jgi:hypothetical protein
MNSILKQIKSITHKHRCHQSSPSNEDDIKLDTYTNTEINEAKAKDGYIFDGLLGEHSPSHTKELY